MIFKKVHVRHFCTKVTQKFTSTVLLPKTSFPHHLSAQKCEERDTKVNKELEQLYAWQQKNVTGKEFTLLDGPPYANGKVHIGHAINKVLKDIINRAQLIQERRINYIPGWDCHGLPIELKASTADGAAVDVRKRARDFAKRTVNEQKDDFRGWGVMADWDSSTYQTCNPDYVVRQLQMWWELYSRGLVYRDLKPVYWSPSSKTALAEAELVYKSDHVSDAVILRLRLADCSLNSDSSTPVFLLVWTTTPWTLPVNEAVCFSKSLTYSMVTFEGQEGYYIVGSDCVESLCKKFGCEANVVRTLGSSDLADIKYHHPWVNGWQRPVLESAHVTTSGTGLVHVAPAHGHDDFLVGLKHKLSTISLIDSEGQYTTEAGEKLSGLPALTEGSQVVLSELKSDTMHHERYKHSYPYDWRTDKPVMIRASQQWFIDTAQLQKPALDCLKEVKGLTEKLKSNIVSRPYWCISRQRAWGVPIPAFYHRLSGRPLISKSVIDNLCSKISGGNADAWWNLSDTELFPLKTCQELFVKQEDVQRGGDIMDIWLDSGLAWSCFEGRIADVIIEGGDQFTGWFQSSLLTSVALRDVAPTRCILTHGFAVDEDGRKMSKSQGNIVDPHNVTKTYGVDALRWWVANHSHHTHVPASERLLASAREEVVRFRGLIRFLLGALRDTSAELEIEPLTTLDKYMLHTCRTLFCDVRQAYNSFAWNTACTHLVNFCAGPASGLYVHVIKDRLYCDSINSPRRVSCCASLASVLDTLLLCLAPVLPHLAEEAYQHHPFAEKTFWFRTKRWSPPDSWNQPQIAEVMKKALQIKAIVDKQTVKSGTAKLEGHLQLNSADFDALTTMQNSEESADSELTELLQLARVRITKCAGDENLITLKESERLKCPRCRRFTAESDGILCERCQTVVSI